MIDRVYLLSKAGASGGGASAAAERLGSLLHGKEAGSVEHWIVHGDPRMPFQRRIAGLLPGDLDLRLLRRASSSLS